MSKVSRTYELTKVRSGRRQRLGMVDKCLGLRDPDARTNHLGLYAKAHREQQHCAANRSVAWYGALPNSLCNVSKVKDGTLMSKLTPWAP